MTGFFTQAPLILYSCLGVNDTHLIDSDTSYSRGIFPLRRMRGPDGLLEYDSKLASLDEEANYEEFIDWFREAVNFHCREDLWKSSVSLRSWITWLGRKMPINMHGTTNICPFLTSTLNFLEPFETTSHKKVTPKCSVA